MVTLLEQLNLITDQASVIIMKKLEDERGSFTHFDIDSAFDKETEELNELFINHTLEVIADTDSEDNETLYFMGLYGEEYPLWDGVTKAWGYTIKFVSEFGTEYNLAPDTLDNWTTCQLADYISTL
jgi:hypothetical protein